MEEPAEVGEIVDELIGRRHDLGYSQKKLAERAGLHARTVCYLESRGGGGATQFVTIALYANAVGLRLKLVGKRRQGKSAAASAPTTGDDDLD